MILGSTRYAFLPPFLHTDNTSSFLSISSVSISKYTALNSAASLSISLLISSNIPACSTLLGKPSKTYPFAQSGSASLLLIIAATTSTGKFTPEGTVSVPTFTGTGVRLVTGSISTADSATFTGTKGDISASASYTPAGSVTVGTTTATATVSAASSGTTTYTPGGSVGTPTISVKTAGSTTTIKNPTSKTVVTDMSVADPSATAATGELVYIALDGETLILKKLVETTGASITTSNVTVKSGDAAYQSSQPSWSGTAVRLVTGNITVPSGSGTFNGTAATISSTGEFTPAGSVSLTKTNKTATVSATSGTATYTPAGTISQPIFTGTEGDVSVSGTPSGSVSQPTFTGDTKTVTVS